MEKEHHILNSVRNAMHVFRTKYERMDEGSLRLYIDKAINLELDTELFVDVNLRHYRLRDYKNMFNEMGSIVKDYDKIGKRNKKKDNNHLNKHAMHLIRLFMMAIDILDKGEIITYRLRWKMTGKRIGHYLTVVFVLHWNLAHHKYSCCKAIQNIEEKGALEVDKNGTLQYYNESAKQYSEDTITVDFRDHQENFLKHLEPGARILDYGCGSGRDTKYFLNRGYQVDAIDGSEELVKCASEHTGIAVQQMLFQDLNSDGIYDGIWACASILHLNREDLTDVFYKIEKALVSKGILYTSFKYGTEELIRDGRFYMDMTEEKLKSFPVVEELFVVVEKWKSFDVRPGRDNENWFNIILQKKN